MKGSESGTTDTNKEAIAGLRREKSVTEKVTVELRQSVESPDIFYRKN